MLIQPFISTVVSGDRPLPILMSLAFTFGLAIFFRGVVRLVFGVNSREIPTQILTGNTNLPVVGTSSYVRLTTAAFGFAALAVFLYFLYRTEYGTGIRAIAEDKTNARLMGININRYQSLTYGLYVALTATGGVFVGLIYSATPSMALYYTTFAFFMVVLAGLGYVPGVIGTAILLGIAQTVIAVYINTESVLMFLFLGVYLLLLLRPSGIFGRGEAA